LALQWFTVIKKLATAIAVASFFYLKKIYAVKVSRAQDSSKSKAGASPAFPFGGHLLPAQ
jgi:hypothetical protein